MHHITRNHGFQTAVKMVKPFAYMKGLRTLYLPASYLIMVTIIGHILIKGAC